MFENILLATDFSERAGVAREVALGVVCGTDARVTVVTVYDPSEHIIWHSALLDEGTDQEQSLEEKLLKDMIHKKLEEYAAELKKAGIKVGYVLKTGNVAAGIIETAEEIGADLIIIGSHSQQSLADVLLGGTAAAVQAKAPCPVIIASLSRRARKSHK